MAIAYVGLGSNLEDPVTQVISAIDKLAKIPDSSVLARSSLYKSPPLGPQDQPDFINAVIKLETSLSAQDLLVHLQRIEQQHGRRRDQHWGPRTLDLDLLLYDRMKMNEENLTVPHPHIASRAFVLCPLLEVEPGVDIPDLGLAKALLDKLDVTNVVRV